jgi:predicted transcriptional regulator
MTKIRSEEIYIKKLFDDIPVSEIMNTSFAKIKEEGTLSQVQEKFIANRSFYVVVVNEYDQLSGMVSQKYLFKTQSPRKMMNDDVKFQPSVISDGKTFYDKETLDSFRLTSVMNADPTTLTVDKTVSEAISIMSKRHIGCIVIVNKSNIVQGTLAHQEIVNYLADTLK